MDRYVYKPLPAENLCVRLLRLLPGPRDAEIQCEMMNYSIDQSRSYGLYEALSYVWGDPSNKIRVAVRDQDDAHFRYLEVTTNLYAGLLRLRDTRTSRLIWIDAISINQHDLVERGQQVQRMATIYANSSQVVVWLGPGSSDGENPHHCREAFTRIRQSTTHTNVLPDDVRTLLKREWFTRVWVTQEVAAARALSILYGNEEMSGVNFARGLQNFSQAFTSEDKAFATYVPALLDLMVWSPTVSTIHHPLPTLNFAPLEEIVEMFHTKEATDQRDKIYALLGLRSDNGSTRVPIPNYLKPWAHVFREFIQFVLGSEAQV
ncbi:HET-domain-containing protein, partial [Ophiobolus disseminans]